MSKNAEATLLLRIKQAGQAVMDKFVVTLGDVFELTKKLGEALLEPLRQYREQEKAVNNLNTAMVSQGVYSKQLSNEYQEMAKSLQKVTLYSDDQIVQAQAQLQSFLGTTHVTKELTMATLDLATHMGGNLSGAAEKMGKSIGTATNALAREGVAIDVTATKEDRMAQAITGVERKWAGQAKTAADGLGVWQQLKMAFEDLEKELGERLAPIVTFVGQELKKFAEDTQQTKPLIEGITQVFGFFVKACSFAVAEIQNLGTSFGAFTGSAAAAVDQLVHGKFKEAWTTMKDGSAQADKDVAAIWQAHADRVTTIDTLLLEKRTETSKKETDMLRQSAENKARIAGEEGAIAATNRTLQNEQELLDTQTHLDTIKNLSLTAQLERINEMLVNEQSATMQNALEQRKRELLTKMTNEELKRSEQNLFDFRKARREAELQDQKSSLSTISTLQSAHSKELAAIGKAAAITQIAIETPVAVAKALAAFPPPFNFVAAGLVGAAMAVQAAQIAGVPLAEGGIVKATPGGTNAVIGEGGRDEAVIPLDSPEAQGRLGGGGNTYVLQGVFMGDRAQAQEFAKMIDNELLQLRRSGESLAFDTRLS